MTVTMISVITETDNNNDDDITTNNNDDITTNNNYDSNNQNNNGNKHINIITIVKNEISTITIKIN